METLIALHTVKAGGIHYPPGAEFQIDDPAERERLIDMEAACTLEQYSARMATRSGARSGPSVAPFRGTVA